MAGPPEATTIKVRGFDCDLYGHVNNARYLEYLEAGRWDLVEAAIDLEDWHTRGWSFVVVNVNVDYRAAATLGDVLRVSARLGELGRTSARIHQRIVRERDQVTVVEATITFAVVDRASGRPQPLQGELRAQLEAIPSDIEIAPGPPAADADRSEDAET